jgi:hypothetical protein
MSRDSSGDLRKIKRQRTGGNNDGLSDNEDEEDEEEEDEEVDPDEALFNQN